MAGTASLALNAGGDGCRRQTCRAGCASWPIPLREYPELAAQGMRNTGRENNGGPIVTAGGLVFTAATNFDKKFQALDKATGDILWEASRGASFVLVPAGGRSRPGAARESGGVFVAYALPAR
jgi:quinoprotein glucose dehydrogenase